MKIVDLVKLTNKYLAGEQLVYTRLLPFFDQVIDDINSRLNSTYPSFSSLEYDVFYPENAVYDYFPDAYVRSVVALGAAYYFYVMDEEGIETATKYEQKYLENLFYMVRDYIDHVPPFYRSDSSGSVFVNEDYFYPFTTPVPHAFRW